MPNGGYECTTVLVSMGEVIASLKMNVENNILAPQADSVTANTTNTTTATGSADIKDEFELIMDEYCNNPLGLSSPISNIATNSSQIPNIDTNIITFGDPNSYGPDAANDLRYTKFIQLGYFVNFLNEKYNIFLSKSGNLLKYEVPLPNISGNKGTGLCVASYNSITIDNSICIIQNKEAKLFNKDYGFSPLVEGSTLKLEANLTSTTPTIGNNPTAVTPFQAQASNQIGLTKTTQLNEYLYPGTNLGIIGNIYLNIGNIISIYKKLHFANQGKVPAISLLKKILEEVQYALGSANSFDVFSEDNKVIIIDKHYVENPSEASYDSKFKVEILGNHSVVREQKVVSRIFEEQSTMIAIAAQDRENIGSMQSSTNVFMNKRAYNRLYPNSGFSKEDAIRSKEEETKRTADRELFNRNIVKLINYVNDNIVPGKWPKNKDSIQSSLNTFLNTLVVKLEGGTDYKGVLPISLEFKMDGIGGITIGEIFTIDKEILPAEYYDKKIGFIVVGVDEEITRPDWTTSIRAQFCILDQLERQKESLAKRNILFGEIEATKQALKDEIKVSITYRNILIGFIHDFFNDSIGLQNLKDLVYIGNKQPKLFKVNSGQELAGHFFPNSSDYQTKKDLTKSDSLVISLHRYLNTIPDNSQPTGVRNLTQKDYQENVIKYITSAVKNSYYYINMTNSEIKSMFDGEFSSIINAYKSQPSTLGKVGAAVSIVAEILVETFSGGFFDYQDAISNNVKYVESDKVKLYFLNPEAYTDYGEIDKQKLMLSDIMTINFDDNFKSNPPTEEAENGVYTATSTARYGY